MSCMIAPIQGGNPSREIFPVPPGDMTRLQELGLAEIFAMLGVKRMNKLPFNSAQYVGTALRPDGRPFYLTTIAPDFGPDLKPVGKWRGGFFAPFGVGDIVGIIEGELFHPDAMPTTLSVKARLLLDAGGNPAKSDTNRSPFVSVDWEVRGSQATRPNKAALIGRVTINDPGPHNPVDIQRCIALHAPERAFGQARAIVAMQCGVAAACLLEAIC